MYIHVYSGYDTKPHILLRGYTKTITGHEEWPLHATTAVARGMSNATEDLGGTVSQPTRTRNVENGKLIVIQYAW